MGGGNKAPRLGSKRECVLTEATKRLKRLFLATNLFVFPFIFSLSLSTEANEEESFQPLYAVLQCHFLPLSSLYSSFPFKRQRACKGKYSLKQGDRFFFLISYKTRRQKERATCQVSQHKELHEHIFKKTAAVTVKLV